MGGELETRSAGRRIIEKCMGHQKIMDVWIVDGIECLLVLLVECIMCIDS